jgi:hypothetical protein
VAVTTPCEGLEKSETLNEGRLALTRGLALQFALLLVALGLYLTTRRLTMGNALDAADNARGILDLEAVFGLDVEHTLQRLILESPSLITLMNWIYVWGHWPVLAITAIWLFMRHRREFSLFRNALIISGLLGLVVFALFPVMPPRLLGIGMVDTVAQWSSSHQILQPPSLVNQYAAVPSFHVGWNVLVAVAIFRARPKWDLRVVAIILPIAMIASVVLTGNHYLLDAVAGIAVVAVAWIIGERIERRRPVRT